MNAYRFKYTVDEARRLIVFRVTGAVPSSILLDNFLAAYRGIPDAWRYDRLIDYRRYTGLMDFADLENFAEKNRELNGGRPPQYRVAVVSDDAFEQARPATTRHLFPEDVRTFATMHDAMNWLGRARETDETGGLKAG